MAKKQVVGLVVLTDIPGMGRVAVLQRRGEFNHEKMGPESYPGACQVTVHGKVEEDENLWQGLNREVREEVGEALCQRLFGDARGFGESGLKEVLRLETEKKIVVTYACCELSQMLECVRLGPSSGGLRLLREDEVDFVQDLNNYDKRDGVTDRRVVAMFPDEKEAVVRAFVTFGTVQPISAES